MALYLISYDINEKDAFEYQKLWDKLKEMNSARILYSEWIIIGDSARSIYSQLAPLTQLKDRLLVQEITKDAVWDKLLIGDDTFRKWLAYAR